MFKWLEKGKTHWQFKKHFGDVDSGMLAGVALSALLLLVAWPTNSARLTDIGDGSTEQVAQVIETHEEAVPEAPKPQAPASPPPLLPKPKPFLFGVGTELDQAISSRIVAEAPVKMLTSWFNGTKDLGFMSGWQGSLVPQAYAKGYTLHLIVYSNDPEHPLNTPHGPACGRAYPVSAQFINDMKQLSQIFKGGPLYVSLFTELQTYPCEDNMWQGSENYYKTLQDNYTAALNIFHATAPGSKVSITWGGWQTKWDDPGRGGGKSLLNHFAPVMNASDYQSFQSMATTGNLDIIADMTAALNAYPGGVMAAHYKPDNGNQSTFEADMLNIFTPANLAGLQKNGLFAFSFMDTVNMNHTESSFQTVKNIVRKYAQ